MMAQRAPELAKQISAGAKYIRMSPYKVREVALLIKGKPIDEARRILAFTPKAACREVSKVLESAIANAEHNFQIPQEELYVKTASADEGVTIKRFRPRAQGRGFRIRKRTSHINMTLERLPEALIELHAQPTRRTPKAKGKAEGAGARPTAGADKGGKAETKTATKSRAAKTSTDSPKKTPAAATGASPAAPDEAAQPVPAAPDEAAQPVPAAPDEAAQPVPSSQEEASQEQAVLANQQNPSEIDQPSSEPASDGPAEKTTEEGGA